MIECQDLWLWVSRGQDKLYERPNSKTWNIWHELPTYKYMGIDVHLPYEKMDATMIWWPSQFNDTQHVIYNLMLICVQNMWISDCTPINLSGWPRSGYQDLCPIIAPKPEDLRCLHNVATCLIKITYIYKNRLI